MTGPLYALSKPPSPGLSLPERWERPDTLPTSTCILDDVRATKQPGPTNTGTGGSHLALGWRLGRTRVRDREASVCSCPRTVSLHLSMGAEPLLLVSSGQEGRNLGGALGGDQREGTSPHRCSPALTTCVRPGRRHKKRMSRLCVRNGTKLEEDTNSLYCSLKCWIRIEMGFFQCAYLIPWVTVQDPIFTRFPHFASLHRCWQPSTPGSLVRSWEPISNLSPVWNCKCLACS